MHLQHPLPYRIARAALCGYSWLVLCFLIGPLFVVFPMSFSSSAFFEFPPQDWSFRWYEEFLADTSWVDSIKNSILVGLVVTFFATTLGTMAAVGLSRASFQGKQALIAFLISPMIMPLIVTAVALYFLFALAGWIGSFHVMIIAHTVLATPFVIVVVFATLQGYDPNLDRAAASSGASPLRTFFRVTFPVIAPGVLSGAAFAFVTSFDEVVIALFLSGTEWRTLPVKMFEDIRFEIRPTITAVAAIVITISTILLSAVELFRRRGKRLRALGRSGGG